MTKETRPRFLPRSQGVVIRNCRYQIVPALCTRPLRCSVLFVLCAGIGVSWVQAGEWSEEFSAGNFLFRSEFPLRDVQDLLNDIADLQEDVETALGVTCSNREIQVHLFRSRMSYQRYLSVRVPQGAKRQAFYMPGTDAGRIYAYRNRNLELDVRHETTHALLKNALPYLPLWLDEGLAEYFEVPKARRAHGDGHLQEIRLAQKLGWRPDLKRLEAKRGFLELGAREYRDAWAIVSYLIDGPPEAQQVFRKYLQDIEDGNVPGPLSDVLAESLPGYEQDILRQMRRP